MNDLISNNNGQIIPFSLREEHRYICDCGHKIQQHLFCFGCTTKFCNCTAYSQTKQLKNIAFSELDKWD
jgi:coenzyme F420-reducing hydrogenase gamma subunit